MKNLQEIKANLDKLDKEFKQIRADVTTDSNNEMYWKIMDNCYQMVSSVRNYIYALEDGIYKDWENHKKNHPPKLLTATQLENYLEMCGMSNDYNVEKPKIEVRANRQGNKEFQIDLGSIKKV
ncbi:MAG: hypothetical protein AABY22_16670 [Nanoarchaeota archaeon]